MEWPPLDEATALLVALAGQLLGTVLDRAVPVAAGQSGVVRVDLSATQRHGAPDELSVTAYKSRIGDQ